MESIWRKQVGAIPNAGEPDWKTLQQIQWDVIVVGAGMAGILTAYLLQEEGKRVLVLEAKTIASGQTERTTAKVTCQHGPKYGELIETLGETVARAYAKANQEAIERYEQLIQKEKIQCDWQRVPAYLYSTQDEKILKKEVIAAGRLGIDAYFTPKTELPFEIKGAVCFPKQAQFSPLAFIRHLAAKLLIKENTKVLQVKGHTVITEKGWVKANQIVLATHYPVLNVPGFYFLRQHQERSYVLALQNTPKLHGMYYGIENSGLSLRQAGEYLLFGGGAKRTGENECGGIYEMLRIRARQLYPECQEAAHWSAQDCMPHDGLPFIGRYSMWTPHLYVATGFQKWGMSTSMVAAMILKDLVCQRENAYAGIFTPQRLHLGASMASLLTDVGVSVKGLAKGLFRRGRRCTHLGCALTWNADEKSWDCPCHGSRFDEEGRLLDNPAKRSVRLKMKKLPH